MANPGLPLPVCVFVAAELCAVSQPSVAAAMQVTVTEMFGVEAGDPAAAVCNRLAPCSPGPSFPTEVDGRQLRLPGSG